ncbi:hypothetical protein FBUS_05530, partial [Fasciolopsis buskii]
YVLCPTEQTETVISFGDDVVETRNVYKVCLQEALRGSNLITEGATGENAPDWRKCIGDGKCKRMLYDCLALELNQPRFAKNAYAQTMLRSINRLNSGSDSQTTKRS